MARTRLECMGYKCSIEKFDNQTGTPGAEMVVNGTSFFKIPEQSDGANASVIYFKEKNTSENQKTTQKEVAVKKLKPHPNIKTVDIALRLLSYEMLIMLTLYPSEWPYRTIELKGNSPMQAALIMPKLPGITLFKALEFMQTLKLNEIISLFHTISLEVAKLHDKGYCHGDLHSGNLLLADNRQQEHNQNKEQPFIIHLIDFGFSYSLQNANAYCVNTNAPYLAPERRNEKITVAPDPSQDVYSLCYLLHILITSYRCASKIDQEIMKCIRSGMSNEPKERTRLNQLIASLKKVLESMQTKQNSTKTSDSMNNLEKPCASNNHKITQVKLPGMRNSNLNSKQDKSLPSFDSLVKNSVLFHTKTATRENFKPKSTNQKKRKRNNNNQAHEKTCRQRV